MELVLVAHGGRAAFHIAYVSPFVGNDERALELPAFLGVDAEIRREFHRAPHPFGDIDETAVAEHRRIERGKVIVARRHDRTQVFLDQVGMVLDGLADGAEDDALLGQIFRIHGLYRHRVHDGVHRHLGQFFLFVQLDAQLLEGLQQFGIHARQRVILLGLRGGVVDDVLVVDGRVIEMPPMGFAHFLPLRESRQAELQHIFRFLL